MSKKHVYAIFDVETLGTFGNPICYDIGLVIATRYNDKPIYQQRWLVKETLDKNNQSNKILKEQGKNWWIKKGYKEKTRQIYLANPECYKPFNQIHKEILALLKFYKVNIISAYNLNFDYRALKKTAKRYLNKAFFKQDYKMLCLWTWATTALFKQRTYHKVAKQQGWVSDAGNLRTTAEHCYRYITKQYDYKEEHTALEDALLEFEILKYCIKQKKKIRWGIFQHPWKFAQTPFAKVGGC